MTDEEHDDEQSVVWNRRYAEARRAGLEHMDAIRYARSDADIGELRSLVKAGCPPDKLRAIVL